MILEYENTNSRIAYPFIDGVVSAHTPYVTPGFLVDFQFVDYTNTIKRVYISRITNTIAGNLVLYFNDVDTTTLIGTLTVAAADAVSHIGNQTASFVSTSTSNYAIKVVFGPEVANIISANFDTSYLAAETTFSPDTVVLYHPVVKQLVAKNNYPATTAMTYTAGDSVLLSPGANLDTILENGALSMDVFQRAGTGLFGTCDDSIAGLLKINQLTPNTDGTFYIATDNCYELTLLTTTDLTTYAANLATYTDAGVPFTAGSALLIQNHCSAKCPPESLNALADYINRLRNGVQELYDLAVQPNQTAGTAAALTSGLYSFTALSFSTVESGASGFIKYWHEGHYLNITYSTGVTQTSKIVTVVSTTQVIIADELTNSASSGVATFTVSDLGIYNQLTAAIDQYNTDIAPVVNSPYGQIIYTTTEGINAVSEYGTFVSIVAGVYNPTNAAINFSVDFSPSSELSGQTTTFKLRQDGVVTIDPTFPVSLACKDYATVEEVFFIPCGPNTGTIDVSITSDWTGSVTTVTNGYLAIPVSSTDCTGSSGATVEVATAPTGVVFNHDAPLPVGATSGVLFVNTSSLPSWIDPTTGITSAMPPASGHHNFTGTPSVTTNTSYLVTATIFADGVGTQYDLIINAIGLPVVTGATVSADLGVAFLYPTSGTLATNSPTYSATGLSGTGLSIDAATGVISGTPTSITTITAGITATNAAGSGTGTITIDVGYAPPVITSVLTQTITQGVPFTYQILATNAPSGTTYSATALSGTGLSINTSTGVISGTPTGTSTITSLIGVSASGGSTSATLTLTNVALAPVITSSTTTTAAVGSAFSYTITASHTPTSYPAVTGLPAGITQSGAVLSGTPTATAGVYNVTIAASNSSGTGSSPLRITLSSTVPVITSNLSIGVAQGNPFTYQIVATNSPTSYSQTGMPGALTLNTTTGLISGTLTSTGLTSFSITATNGSGHDTETLQINVTTAAAPVITSATSFSCAQGVATGYQITASNYPVTYGLTSTPTAPNLVIPVTAIAGMSLHTSTGLIYGIPTGFGTFSVTVYAYNSAGNGNTAVVFTVAQSAPVIVSSSTFPVPHATLGTYTIIASNTPTSYGFSGPGWLSLTESVVSGTAPGSSGTDGVGAGDNTFSSASANFTGLEGTYITVGSLTYKIVTVTDAHDIIVSGLIATGTGLTYYLSTSMVISATNAVGTTNLTVPVIIT